jgi:2',3'-cyclic-nucleotide 2'-phosphodiesterase (5'-nucleotidase family)
MKKIRLWLIATLLLAILTSWAGAAPAPLRILYVNDFHGHAQPQPATGRKEPCGGVAYLAGAVEFARGKHPSLLLAAGDMIQGNTWANLFRGQSTIEVMNAMKFDAMVVGNHEFDYGLEVLQERISQAHFPILGTNVKGLPALKPYVIKTLGAFKVAILGVVTQDTLASHPQLPAYLKITSPASAVRKLLPELRCQADVILVLSHLGYKKDRKLAKAVPEINVIIGGHSHTKISKPEMVGRTIIVQAWEKAKALGVLDLRLRGGKITGVSGKLMKITPQTCQPVAEVQKIVDRYEQLAGPMLQTVIGETRVDLEVEGIRGAETNLGDFVADVMRQTTGADVALINAGSIKARIAQGQITVGNVYNALPYDNYLVAVRLTGAQLKGALEHGLAGRQEPGRRFPQVSGLRFTYRRSAPAGSRVQHLTVAGQPLDPGKEYVVATIDFLIAGGDGYTVFGEVLKDRAADAGQGGMLPGGKLAYNDPGTWLRDLVIQAIKTQKTIAPTVDGRIKAVD